MKTSPLQLIVSALCMLLAIAVISVYVSHAALVGELSLWLRACWLNTAVLALLAGAFASVGPSRRRLRGFLYALCLPALMPAFIYFLVILPAGADEGIEVGPLELDLITDRSSNGIVEIGFEYPIFTPLISLRNTGLYTRRVQVFFRIVDEGGQAALYRAVREDIPDQGLSVEATVRGMLSQNQDYLFNPLTLPPGRSVSGRMVFIITAVESGLSFSDALRTASSARLELRDLEGELIASLAVSGL